MATEAMKMEDSYSIELNKLKLSLAEELLSNQDIPLEVLASVLADLRQARESSENAELEEDLGDFGEGEDYDDFSPEDCGKKFNREESIRHFMRSESFRSFSDSVTRDPKVVNTLYSSIEAKTKGKFKPSPNARKEIYVAANSVTDLNSSRKAVTFQKPRDGTSVTVSSSDWSSTGYESPNSEIPIQKAQVSPLASPRSPARSSHRRAVEHRSRRSESRSRRPSSENRSSSLSPRKKSTSRSKSKSRRQSSDAENRERSRKDRSSSNVRNHSPSRRASPRSSTEHPARREGTRHERERTGRSHTEDSPRKLKREKISTKERREKTERRSRTCDKPPNRDRREKSERRSRTCDKTPKKEKREKSERRSRTSDKSLKSDDPSDKSNRRASTSCKSPETDHQREKEALSPKAFSMPVAPFSFQKCSEVTSEGRSEEPAGGSLDVAMSPRRRKTTTEVDNVMKNPTVGKRFSIGEVKPKQTITPVLLSPTKRANLKSPAFRSTGDHIGHKSESTLLFSSQVRNNNFSRASWHDSPSPLEIEQDEVDDLKASKRDESTSPAFLGKLGRTGHQSDSTLPTIGPSGVFSSIERDMGHFHDSWHDSPSPLELEGDKEDGLKAPTRDSFDSATATSVNDNVGHKSESSTVVTMCSSGAFSSRSSEAGLVQGSWYEPPAPLVEDPGIILQGESPNGISDEDDTTGNNDLWESHFEY